MKKFVFFSILLLVPTLAVAGMNIQQKSHGGAVWVQSADSTTVPAGDTGIVVEMTDLVNAATKYVIASKTGNITKIWSVLQGAITGNATVTVGTNNVLGTAFTNTGHSLTITASGSAAGDVDSSTVSPTTATRVEQGDVIAIIGNGNPSAQTGGAIFTIVIE
jgi:hypothetical protein